MDTRATASGATMTNSWFSSRVEDQLPLASRKEMRPMWRLKKDIEANLESRKIF
jgi:hypothetical protein